MIKGGTTYRLLKDDLGSVRLVVSVADGSIAQRLDYDPWGNVTFMTPGTEGFQPFGFEGGLYDPDTHLVRFGARDYDPEVGRWTTKDPASFSAGDTNLYAYVLNDPVNDVDLFGLCPCNPADFGHRPLTFSRPTVFELHTNDFRGTTTVFVYGTIQFQGNGQIAAGRDTLLAISYPRQDGGVEATVHLPGLEKINQVRGRPFRWGWTSSPMRGERPRDSQDGERQRPDRVFFKPALGPVGEMRPSHQFVAVGQGGCP